MVPHHGLYPRFNRNCTCNCTGAHTGARTVPYGLHLQPSVQHDLFSSVVGALSDRYLSAVANSANATAGATTAAPVVVPVVVVLVNGGMVAVEQVLVGTGALQVRALSHWL